MKIGIVSPYFYPWFGGITEHVYHQYKELKLRGHSVRLITPFNGQGMLDDENDLIKIGRPIPLILNGSVVKVPIITKRKKTMNGILAKEHFDILHLHQPLFCLLGLTFLQCIKERKLRMMNYPRVVGTFHACGGGTERFLIKCFGFFFKRFYGEFDFKIAVSSASRDFVLPVLPGEYSIIPNGVDVQRFSNEKKKISRFDDGTFNILFVGRLEPRKGLTRLLKSMPYISSYTSKPYRLIVVGNGALTNYYKSRIPRETAHKVFFTGEASFDDLPKYYRTAHIFCSPASYGESFGIVLIEAMAAGLPIIAGYNEGYRKVIRNGINGILVDSEDPKQIAINIGRLIESENERNLFSIRNLEESKKYSWSNIIDSIENVYMQFLSYEQKVS